MTAQLFQLARITVARCVAFAEMIAEIRPSPAAVQFLATARRLERDLEVVAEVTK